MVARNEVHETNIILAPPPTIVRMHVGVPVALRDGMVLELETDGTTATFSVRELRELLEWVRANRAPSRMAPIDAADAPPPGDCEI